MKKLLALTLACLLVFTLAACGNSGNSNEGAGGTAGGGEISGGAQAVDGVNLKFNLVKSNTDPQYEWYGRFFADVEAATNGAVTAEIYTTESLGTTADVLEQASLGEAVIADCDVAYLANYVPDFAAVMSPYLIQEPGEGLVLWNSDVFQKMCRDLEDKGLHLIALNYEGTRNLFTKAPVASREDVGSMKIRCASTTMWNAVVDVLGGNATNIAMSETYQALSQGVADGCEGVYSVFYSNKWYENLDYITKTEHLIGFTAIVMSSQVYDSLSQENRDALDKVAYDYMEEFLDLSGGVQDEFMQRLVDEGVVIEEIDKSAFIQAAQSVPDYFPEWTDGIYQELQSVLEASRG